MHVPPDHVISTQATAVLAVLQQAIDHVQQGRPVDSFLQQLYRRHREYGSRDRRLYSNLVYSFFRWKGWTDLAPALPLAARAAAAYRLDFPESHPALDKLAPLDAPVQQAATLAGKAEQVASWLGLPTPPPAAALVPADALPLLARPSLPDGQDPDALLFEAFQTRPPAWIRIRPEAEADMTVLCGNLHLTPVPHPLLPGAWRVDDVTRLADLLARAGGRVDIQDIASQATGLVAAPAAGSSWWDVCAGSAGKSLQLADMTKGRIKILATDIREGILTEAQRRLDKAGRTGSIKLKQLDATQDLPPAESFDGVLVDAPCSGTGTWARNPDARWRWKAETVAEQSRLQENLLDRAAGCVKPGGVLIYSTCSLTTAENTDRVALFLKSHADFSLAPFMNPLTGEPCSGQTYFWPWDGPGSGFFIARLVRAAP
jgi:16S rRNA (cytosine967-C5)-methyltransferase